MTLEALNMLPPEQAETELSKCCGSSRWDEAMSAARPFASSAQLFTKAEEIWWSLTEEDWLEAFHAHPKIGEKKAAAVQSEQGRKWSAQEQSGVAQASSDTIEQLAQRNRDYEDRFGFIFIVCASGKSSDEILAILNSRLLNEPAAELRVAAAEQNKITRLRLEKLLNL